MAKNKNKANIQTINEPVTEETTLPEANEELVQGIDNVEEVTDEVENTDANTEATEDVESIDENNDTTNEIVESVEEATLPDTNDEYEYLLEVNKIKNDELFLEKVVSINYFKQLISQMELYIPSYKIGGIEAEDKIASIGEKLINIFKVLLNTDDVHLRRIRIKTIIRVYHIFYLKGLNIIIISLGLQKINKSEKDVNNYHKLSTVLLLSENPAQRINYHLRDFDYGPILEDYYSSL